MPSFSDTTGRTWDVRVDVGAVKRALDLANVDLRVIESGKTMADIRRRFRSFSSDRTGL